MATIGIGSEGGRAGGGEQPRGPRPGGEPSDGVQQRLTDGEGTQGGVVTETGIALVEQGEMIVPSPGSRAAVELARSDAGTEVHIHLPVVVEVVGRRDDLELSRLADETLRRLRLAIEAQPMEA